MDTAVKLGEVILIPYYGLGQDLTFDPEIPRETREEIRGFSIANPGFIERLRVGGMTCLAWLDPGGSDGPEALGASAPREPSGEAVNSAVLAAGLEKVERALDYIRVQCCRFDRPESVSYTHLDVYKRQNLQLTVRPLSIWLTPNGPRKA